MSTDCMAAKRSRGIHQKGARRYRAWQHCVFGRISPEFAALMLAASALSARDCTIPPNAGLVNADTPREQKEKKKTQGASEACGHLRFREVARSGAVSECTSGPFCRAPLCCSPRIIASST